MNKTYDPVNHPKHYTSHPSGIECIQITEHLSFTIGNAIKYLWRADEKGGVEDLEKAVWYINREIEKRTKKTQPSVAHFTWHDPKQLPVEYQNYPVNGAGYSGNYHEADAAAQNNKAAFERGDIVRKRSGSAWEGRVCGEYSTSLTPKGYAVESDKHPGSVQIYPEAALELIGLKQQAALASWPVPPPRTIGGSAYKPPQILNNKKVADILNKEFNTQMKDCPND